MVIMTWTKRIIRSRIPAFYQERQELEMLRGNVAGWIIRNSLWPGEPEQFSDKRNPLEAAE
jgi:hypothetical protein